MVVKLTLKQVFPYLMLGMLWSTFIMGLLIGPWALVIPGSAAVYFIARAFADDFF